MADEVFEDQNEVHPLVLDALFERLEGGGSAALVRLPLEFVELEGLLQRASGIFANRTADEESTTAAASGEISSDTVCEGDRFAFFRFVFNDAIEVFA